jgi:hypothetical protein
MSAKKSLFGSLGTLAGAVLNMDGVIDRFRRYAHTRQRGKSRLQAIADFKALAPKLYKANEEPVPYPPGFTPPPEPEPEPEPVIEPEIQVPDLVSPMASEHDVPLPASLPQGLLTRPASSASQDPTFLDFHPVSEIYYPVSEIYYPVSEIHSEGSRRGPLSAESVTPEGQSYDDNKGYTVAPTAQGGLVDGFGESDGVSQVPAAPAPAFSKDWWTPGRAVGIATAGIAIGALVGSGIALLNKFFRGRKDKQEGKQRLHARSWKLSTSDMEQTQARF